MTVHGVAVHGVAVRGMAVHGVVWPSGAIRVFYWPFWGFISPYEYLVAIMSLLWQSIHKRSKLYLVTCKTAPSGGLPAEIFSDI